MSLNEEIFQNWHHFWHSQAIKIARQGANSKTIKPSSLPKTEERDVAARGQVSVNEDLVAGID